MFRKPPLIRIGMIRHDHHMLTAVPTQCMVQRKICPQQHQKRFIGFCSTTTTTTITFSEDFLAQLCVKLFLGLCIPDATRRHRQTQHWIVLARVVGHHEQTTVFVRTIVTHIEFQQRRKETATTSDIDEYIDLTLSYVMCKITPVTQVLKPLGKTTNTDLPRFMDKMVVLHSNTRIQGLVETVQHFIHIPHRIDCILFFFFVFIFFFVFFFFVCVCYF